MDLRTDQHLTWVGGRDTCVSKNILTKNIQFGNRKMKAIIFSRDNIFDENLIEDVEEDFFGASQYFVSKWRKVANDGSN